jgi:hypothetical protein
VIQLAKIPVKLCTIISVMQDAMDSVAHSSPTAPKYRKEFDHGSWMRNEFL